MQAALLIGSSLTVGAWGCSSAPTPSPIEPVTPAPAASARPSEAPPVPAPPPTASTEASPTPAVSAQPEPTPATTDAPQRGSLARSPIDILTSPDTAFLINYAGSAPLEAARRTCAESRAVSPQPRQVPE